MPMRLYPSAMTIGLASANIMGGNNSLDSAFCLVQEPWFVAQAGEKVEPIVNSGDQLDNIGFYCELRHRSGGAWVEREISRTSLAEAINHAVLTAEQSDYPGKE